MLPTYKTFARVLATAAGCCLAAMGAAGQGVADFYRGKKLDIVVGTGPGGGYDAIARLVSRHLGRFIPGEPVVIVTNMPGGGGITAANALFNVSAKDGTVIGTFSNALLTLPLISAQQVKFEPGKFVWIGSIAREDGVCLTTAQSGVRTWAELQSTEIVIGTTAPGTTTHIYPAVLRGMMGAKFKLVSGYPDGSQIVLALERGEVQAICQTYSSVAIRNPEWFAKRTVNPIVAIGLERNPNLSDVPSIMELARDDAQRQTLKVIIAPTVAGRPFAAPPGIPADRAAALRAAFMAMAGDAQFVADATKARVEVQPASGAEIDTLLAEVGKTPAATLDQLKLIVAADAKN